MKQLYISLLFLIGFVTSLNAQQQNDSLAKYSYEEIEKKFYDIRFTDKKLCKIYAEKYLSKAKLDGNRIKISRGYFHMAIFYYVISNKDLKSLQYTDSIIEICKGCNDKDFPALGYYTKGVYFYDLGKNKEALEPLLGALEVLKKNINVRLEIDTRNTIIALKNNWSRDEETLRYEIELLNFIKQQNNYKLEFKHEYALGVLNLAISYLENRNYKKGLEMTEAAIIEKIEAGRDVTYYDFVSLAGNSQYYLGNYQAAIDSALKALPYLKRVNNRDVVMEYYYLAKSYDKLKQPEKAQFYFLKTDSIYQTTKDIFPEMRIAYEHIIDYYKSKNDVENQIKYYDRLLAADAKIDSTYKYVTETVQKRYETPQIIAERAVLLAEAEEKGNAWKYNFGIISALLVAILGVLAFVFRRQKYYKKRFENIMSERSEVLEENISTPHNVQKTSPEALEGLEARSEALEEKKQIEIPEAIIENILKGLLKFETSKGFTKQVTLAELAKKLETNPKYLSKVINWHYEKNFSTYINELRIEHIISKLKSDSKLRNYTIKAIAKEAGFGNTESFSKAFYKNTGISSSYFIKELHKRKDTSASLSVKESAKNREQTNE